MPTAPDADPQGPGAASPRLGDGTGDFLKALASETRQRVMALFAGNAELTVGEVAQLAGMGQSTASEHLALLRRGGLLVSVRDGKAVRYRADTNRIIEHMDALKDYLLRCCPPAGCGGGQGC
ncbi:MAG TPA: helix-turn-helix transcriptional regulator [Yinghuangia sp.]|uniref:ArsR/SmtB family transcription factor n=1 Tax=Yinghuangia sp. YIM S10712 TaxID=3436930 RepID=UPI002C599525|nr:helix-turn-helix transcriptional regulator [Yinghuangia sp.]